MWTPRDLEICFLLINPCTQNDIQDRWKCWWKSTCDTLIVNALLLLPQEIAWSQIQGFPPMYDSGFPCSSLWRAKSQNPSVSLVTKAVRLLTQKPPFYHLVISGCFQKPAQTRSALPLWFPLCWSHQILSLSSFLFMQYLEASTWREMWKLKEMSHGSPVSLVFIAGNNNRPCDDVNSFKHLHMRGYALMADLETCMASDSSTCQCSMRTCS